MDIISTAYAAEDTVSTTSTGATDEAAGPQYPGFTEIGMLLFFFFIFYLLIWRPQSKRAKEQRNLIAGLAVGDEVVMSGGLMGKITELENNVLTVQIADGVSVQFQKQAVAAVLPKGTLK